MDLPNFKNGDDEQVYYNLFDENVFQYKFLLDKVREELYGKGNGNYSNLPGSCFEVINDITKSLIQQTTNEFTKKTRALQSEDHNTFTLGDK